MMISRSVYSPSGSLPLEEEPPEALFFALELILLKLSLFPFMVICIVRERVFFVLFILIYILI